MTPEEIRAEASDRIAGADWDRTPTYAALGAWAEQSENTRNAFTANTYDWIVDALGDLLPTGEERLAAYAVTDESDDRLMQRYVTGWMDVPE